MQITKIANNKSVSKKSSAQKTGGTSFSSHLSQSSEANVASPSSSVSGVMQLDSLLALQEVGDEPSSRKRQIQHGFNIVEHLDQIRIGLLEGKISQSVLNNLDDLINSWREADTDNQLKELIDEIELRAAVELAKLEHS
ncbi:MAG: flagellar assembly protein FliX [Proteobacteria bacterium]|nr:flagellar assembly protein FliX [Pseudomonadota bacterium]